MEKILGYILKGKGIGLKFMFSVALLVSVMFALYIRFFGADLVPYANDIINQMLPIKIENGVIVNPQNTVKVAQLREGNVSIPLPIMLNTNIDELNPNNTPQGIYITRTKIYAIDAQEVRIYPFSGDFEALPQDYSDGLKSGLTWVAFALFVLGSIIISVVYFLAVLVYSVLAWILGLFFSKKYDFDVRMRLSTVAFLSVYILFFVISMAGGSTTNLISFVATLILQAAIIYKMPKIVNEENSDITLPVEEMVEHKSVLTDDVLESKKDVEPKKASVKTKSNTKTAEVKKPKSSKPVKKKTAKPKENNKTKKADKK